MHCIHMMKLILSFLILLVPSLAASRQLRGSDRTVTGNLAFTSSPESTRRGHAGRHLGIFDWEVTPLPDSPSLSNSSVFPGIEFMYNFTGNITEEKSLTVTLFEDDCITPGSTGEGAAILANSSILDNNQFQVQLEVQLAYIDPSEYYETLGDLMTSAAISFCIRVDYNYLDEPVNFHETKVTVTVDLTAGFELTAINVNRTDSNMANLEDQIACEVYEYFCNDQYEDTGMPTLTQGDLVQACIISTGEYNIRDIMEADLDQDMGLDGTIENHDDVITNFETVGPLTAYSCSLGRCTVKTQLTSKYFAEPGPSNITLSGTVVCGFGRAPTVYACNGAAKPVVAENSTFLTYPIKTSLNDPDESDEYESVVVAYSTPGNGEEPVVQFGKRPDGVTFTQGDGQITLTGNSSGIEEAMQMLELRPGTSNGEDITLTITATAVAKADNSLVQVASDSCTIIVDPVIQGTLKQMIPSGARGREDTSFAISNPGILFEGYNDLDGSEEAVFEIDTSTYPARTTFYSGGIRLRTVVDGWLRVQENELAALQIKSPPNFSGRFSISVRAAIIDTTLSNTVIAATSAENIVIDVEPVADSIVIPPKYVGIEDLGAIAFGASLASSSGIALVDRGIGLGNNPEKETISRILVDVPFDTTDVIYTMSGQFVPGNGRTTGIAGSGSAVVTFDPTRRIYAITSTYITGAASNNLALLNQTIREVAEADIRATLATFSVEIGPDLNGEIEVKVTTLDVINGLFDTRDTAFNPIKMKAVADKPGINVTSPASSVVEDGASIMLNITISRSPDNDGSETLSVQFTVPQDIEGPIGTITGATTAGVALTNQGNGVFVVTAVGSTPEDQQNALNSFLDDVKFDPREHFSGEFLGNSGIRVDVISRERATGDEIAPGNFGGVDGTAQTETSTAYIGIVVFPDADIATVSVNGNAMGKEDLRIPVPVSVTLGDSDGSESFIMQIADNLPMGTRVFGANGIELSPELGSTFFILTADDVDELAIQAPQHWSSALQGDITLSTTTIVTDSATGINETSTSLTLLDIAVGITGVADKPNSRIVTVSNQEDEKYDLGSAIGNLTGILVDDDTSEALYILISGLPPGITPKSTSGDIAYLGSGKWQVSEEAVSSLSLPATPNFSGENPYAGVVIKATSQELDGNQATSDEWVVTFDIDPIVDGFSSWTMRKSVTEQANDDGESGGINLGGAANYTLNDADGSETVMSYTFDLSSLIEDAGISVQLQNLAGAGANLSDLVSGYIDGNFVFDSYTGTINVQPGDVSSVALRPELFLDSNQDFSIPVTAIVRDTAVINDSQVFSDKVESGSLLVNLTGSADIPTVFAQSATGQAGSRIPLSLGGTTTDSDIALGRTQSEEIYYIVNIESAAFTPYALVDETGAITGLNNGGGHWMLTPNNLVGLSFLVPPGTNETTIPLQLTTIALENDGDMATNSTLFDVQVTPIVGYGTPIVWPLPPILNLGENRVNEDNLLTLKMNITANASDTTNPTVSVVISNLPTGAEIFGTAAKLNPLTGKYVISAADINAGLVQIQPPLDFSGTMHVTVQGVATNYWALEAKSEEQRVEIMIDPVADGASMSFSPDAGLEDEIIALDIQVSTLDSDGSEQAGNFAYIQLSDGALLLYGNFSIVTLNDEDALIKGTSLVDYYRVPSSQLSSPLFIVPAEHWHGTLAVNAAVISVEPLDDNDGDKAMLSQSSHTIEIAAIADPPVITAPRNISGLEDTAIAIPGLSAALVDVAVASSSNNGGEVLSVKMSGVPPDSVFNAGSNNGDGSWLIPTSALDTLSITPPENYAGTTNLTFTAIALETSNGDEAESSLVITMTVAPVADSFLMVAKDVSINLNANNTTNNTTTARTNLDLNIRLMDTRGTEIGELPAETVTLTFTDVPAGFSIQAQNQGGNVTANGGGSFTVTGSQDQVNALSLAAVGNATATINITTTGGVHTVSIQGFTTDGLSTTDSVSDYFHVFILAYEGEKRNAGADCCCGSVKPKGSGGRDLYAYPSNILLLLYIVTV